MTNENPTSTAPVDKTRAIEAAAREFVRASEPRRIDGDGLIERDDESPLIDFENIRVRETDDGPMLGLSSATARAVRDLLAALALPEPTWTSTVPTEPGRYWFREWIEAQTYPNAGRPVTFEARWLVDIEDVTEKHLDPTWVLDAPAQWAKARREWWPVPISAPPSTGGPKT